MSGLTTVALVCATNLVLGWYSGYQTVGSYVAFWLLCGLALATAWTIVSRIFAPESLPDAGVRLGVVSLSIVVLCALGLGSAGRLTTPGFLAAQAALLAASLRLPRPGGSEGPHRTRSSRGACHFAIPVDTPPPWPLVVVAIGGALLAFAIAYGMTHSPLTLYDSVSYHLFFSARWVQEHALSIIPTPFSDEAQAYAPANGELFFAWLMLPFHGDLLARLGQFPFGLLAGVTLYALARRLGAAPPHAVYPPAFFFLSRPVLEQLVGANVDLVCAAMFLTSLYLGIVAVARDERRDWMLFGVSLGLYWGSKYVALVYTPVFLLLAFARGLRRNTMWALPGIAAFALPWYGRNWLIAGSPIYPATLAIAGITLGRGAFSRAAMLNTIFHTTDVRLFPVMAARAFGPTLFLFWIPAAIVGGVQMVRRGWWPNGFVLLVPAVMIPLYWFGFPVNIDSRFLMPAIGPALLPFAFVFRDDARWNAGAHVVYAGGMVWTLIGLHADIPAAVPWFMQGWLALDGLVARPFALWFAVAATVVAAVWRLGQRTTTGWAIPLLVSIVASAATALTINADRWCRPSPCDYLATTSPYIRPTLLDGWRWMAEHVTHSTVAYTGINLPYPLTGPQLANRVIYVNIDGRPRWRFHDYDRAYRAGRFAPEEPLLATSSGELLPVAAGRGPRDDALRPRYERMQGSRDAWVFNLETEAVRHLFVAALSPYEIDFVWHNERGFPIEDEWAKSDPQMFQLLYENPQVRIYAIDPGKKHRA
jgi:hypothetical protein